MANNYTLCSTKIPLNDAERAWLEDNLPRIVEITEAECDYVGFTAEIEHDGLWISHDESADTNQIERLLQAFVEQFPERVVGMEFAYTCSKPRPGEFGGAALVVRAGQDVEWLSTGYWLAQQGLK